MRGETNGTEVPPEMVDLHVVAAELDVDVRTLKRWCLSKRFPRIYKLSAKTWRVRRRDLDAWIEERELTRPRPRPSGPKFLGGA